MSGDELPPELEQMIDAYEGDGDEYAKGVVDTWLHFMGRTPEYSGARQRRNAELAEVKRQALREREERRARAEAEVPF